MASWGAQLIQRQLQQLFGLSTAPNTLIRERLSSGGLAGLNHLHHLKTKAAGTTFTIKSHQNQTGGAGYISLVSSLTGLLIKATRLVKKLAAMVSPLVTTARCWLLASLSRNFQSGRNGRDGARKGNWCQEFLGVRKNDQAADTKSVNDQVTITSKVSTLGNQGSERLSHGTD
jgi:hypothetical protein